MTIEDIRDVPGKGIVVGGINSTLDHFEPEAIEIKIWRIGRNKEFKLRNNKEIFCI
jgi:hypothetical protein